MNRLHFRRKVSAIALLVLGLFFICLLLAIAYNQASAYDGDIKLCLPDLFPSSTPQITPESTPSATLTPTDIATPSATSIPTPTITISPTAGQSATPTSTPAPTVTPTPTANFPQYAPNAGRATL